MNHSIDFFRDEVRNGFYTPILWMGTGFLLLYKRFESGSLSWPRNTTEAAEITEEEFNYLMLGLNPLDPKIKQVAPESTY